jgi:hypothetical protein
MVVPVGELDGVDVSGHDVSGHVGVGAVEFTAAGRGARAASGTGVTG